MRRRFILSALLALVAMVATSHGGGAQAPDQIVRTLIAAMNAGDAAAIRAAFAPNAAQAYGDGAPKTGAAFARWLESDVIERQGKVANPMFVITGNDVVVTGQFSNNAGYRSAANFLFKVDNGKIVGWQMRY